VVTDADDDAWWLAGDGQWHEGAPPAGWVQAGDRRWYPDEPPDTAKGYASKFESAGGRTATVLALVAPAHPPALEAPDGDVTGADAVDDDLAWWPDDAGDDDDDLDDERRRRPAWVLVGVLVALLLAVVGVVGLVAGTDIGTDGDTGPTVDSAPPTSAAPRSTTSVTTAAPATTVDAGPLNPSVTVAPPATVPSTTVPPSATVPSTTVPPDTTPGPPATGPNPGGPPGQSVVEGRRCSDVGATAVATNGTPVTCVMTACDGDPYEDPRWRRTTC
jgi:hypothetical protein